MNIGVSVCVFTYNYANYIAQALDSILLQKCSFPVEIIIGDDLSTDNTRDIARKYQALYPDIIRLSFNETNIGGTRNWIKTMKQCRGKYIALLDGDDYFTDPLKLQKQYDALEKNSDAVLCLHGVEEKYEDVIGADKIVLFNRDEYYLEDFLRKGWFVRTSSTFFRNNIVFDEPPEWVYDFPYRYDTILHVFLCSNGKAINLKEVMSVWRKHSKGMSAQLIEQGLNNMKQEIALAAKLNEYTNKVHQDEVKDYIFEMRYYMIRKVIRMGVFWKHFKLFIDFIKNFRFILCCKKVFSILDERNKSAINKR